DDAVGDDHVDGGVVEGDVFDVSLDELDVGYSGFGGVAAGELEHLIGHVHPVDESGRAYSPCRQEDVDAASRTQVEDHLALFQVGDRGRVAAPQADFFGAFRQRLELGRRVRPGGQVHPQAGVGRATVATTTARRGGGGHGVAFTHLLPDFGRLAHTGPLISTAIEA